MNRRRFVTGALLMLVFTDPALATDRVDQIVQSLRREGYTRIEIGRTWLGRTRIIASGGPGRREIVVQPATGEVLRDFESVDDNNDDDDSGRGRGRGRGRGGDDDDDDDNSGSDDSDDDDSDDDDSGDDSGGGDDGGQGRGRGRGGDD